MRLGRMNKAVLKLAGPSILANITVPLVGMVDLGIAGRLGDAALIGAIAISTMLFDLLYWNMGFLRVGTGGMVAQAYGAKNFKEVIRVFNQGMITALGVAILIWIIQWWYIDIAFKFIECSPQVEELARQYYFIRIWAAPATLSLFVFKGFFIGMQNAVLPMIVDITVNMVNLGASIYFAMFTPMKFAGIAMGTLTAQYSGAIIAIVFMFLFYRKFFKYATLKESLILSHMKNFFLINKDLFLRSICFLFIYTGFTSLSAGYGDTLLAVSTIILKIMMIYSYFLDGFAYAGEALTGKFTGARNMESLKLAVRVIFKWAFTIGIISTICYGVWGIDLCRLLTDNADVIEASKGFLGWLLIMPILSCVAFTWDGIFIGATASISIRNAMFYSVLGFFATYYGFKSFGIGINALWSAYMVHLIVRSLYLTFKAKKEIFTWHTLETQH